jgi:hypothetical protein
MVTMIGLSAGQASMAAPGRTRQLLPTPVLPTLVLLLSGHSTNTGPQI